MRTNYLMALAGPMSPDYEEIVLACSRQCPVPLTMVAAIIMVLIVVIDRQQIESLNS